MNDNKCWLCGNQGHFPYQCPVKLYQSSSTLGWRGGLQFPETSPFSGFQQDFTGCHSTDVFTGIHTPMGPDSRGLPTHLHHSGSSHDVSQATSSYETSSLLFEGPVKLYQSSSTLGWRGGLQFPETSPFSGFQQDFTGCHSTDVFTGIHTPMGPDSRGLPTHLHHSGSSHVVSQTGTKRDNQPEKVEDSSHRLSDNKQTQSDGEHKRTNNESVSETPKIDNAGTEQGMKITSEEGEKKIKVHFHAVVSPAFKFCPEKDQVFIRFQVDTDGEMTDRQWKMAFQRQLPDNKGYMMHGTVPVPKDLFSQGHCVKYQYYVGIGEKDYIEFIPKVKKGNEKVYRELSIPVRKENEIIEWHQYDGSICRIPKESFWKKINRFLHTSKEWNTMLEENKRAYKAMMPQWMDEGNTTKKSNLAEQFTEDVSQVLSCAKTNTDADMARQILFEYIYPQLVAFSVEDPPGESPETAERRLVLALAVIRLLTKWDLVVDKVEGLCTALCLKPSENSSLNEIKWLARHFPKTMKYLSDDLKKFLLNICQKTPLWVLSIPLFHLLKGNQSQIKAISTFHESAEWWGTSDLEKHITQFQSNNILKDSDIEMYKTYLVPLLNFDHYLPRTLTAIITWKKASQNNMILFTIEALLANLHYTLKSSSHLPTDDLSSLWKLLQQAVESRKSNIQKIHDDKTWLAEVEVAQMQAWIGLDVLQLLANRGMCDEAVIPCFQLIAKIIQNAEKASSLRISDQIQREREFELNKLHKRFKKITKMLLSSNNSESEIDIPCMLKKFSQFLDIDFGDTTSEEYRSYVMYLLEENYQVKPNSSLIYYCFKDFSRYHHQIQQFLENKAFDAAVLLCENSDTISEVIDVTYEHGAKNRIGKLLSNVFQQKWHNDPTEDTILELVLSWSGFVRYVSLLYGEKDEFASELLSDDVQNSIQTALSVFDMTVKQLLDGTLSLTKLDQLENKRQNLLRLQTALDKGEATGVKPGISQILEKVIDWRKTELDTFRDQKKKIARLRSVCQVLGADVADLNKMLATDENQLRLCEVCVPRLYTNTDSLSEPYIPVVTYFELSAEVLQVAKWIHKFTDSEIFMNIMKHHNQHYEQSDPLTVDRIILKVCPPAYDEFNKVFEQLKTGKITYLDIERYFGCYKNNPRQLESEFSKIWEMFNEDESLKEERIQQVTQHFLISQYRNQAELIKEVVKMLELKGDFTKLDDLLSRFQVDQSMELKTLSGDLLKTCELLIDKDRKKERCLEEFLKCKDVVVWLQKSLKGPNEVKLLVDLALITASGQGDVEVHKVKSLHDAVIGYAPLIYELKPDADLDKFADILKSVLRSLDSDPAVPTKLKYIQDNFDWLKKVKESKGSMEMNAFEKVKQINKKGIYKIGKIKDASPKSVEEAMQLVIPGDFDSEESNTCFNYQQLNDLQSRLMLVAGKALEGKNEVDRFVEIFDGVTRIATVYMKLCNTGTILFRNWVAMFYCEPDRKCNAQITFGHDHHLRLVDRTEQIDVIKQICLVLDFLNRCLEEWNHTIKANRIQFPTLNYFTTEQLVILCEQLANLFNSSGQVDHSVYLLVHPIHPNCTAEALRKAFDDAFSKIDDLGRKEASDLESQTNGDRGEVNIEMVEEEADLFINNLMECRYSKKLAQQALKKFGTENLQDAIIWCQEEQTEVCTESDQTDESSSEEEITSEPLKYSVDKTLHSLTTDLLGSLQNKDNSLEAKLQELWDKYLANMSTSVREFLSVEDLGHILKCLEVPVRINRDLPQYLKVGQPNLITCPKARMLQVTLSLYIHHTGKDKPLPQRDEVLLCSADTQAEEVELLLRRASTDTSGKLYCLAGVDQLDFDVEQKADSFFEEHCTKNPGMRLVVICSCETEDYSYIVNYLERFRVQYPAFFDLGDIQCYLKHQFTADDSHISASKVDPDCCCVRLVKSHKAAAGKSLKVQRMKQKLENIIKKNNYNDSLPFCISIAIHGKQVDVPVIMKRLKEFIPDPEVHVPRIFHFDLDHEVTEGVDHFLFNLLILGSVMDKDGTVWQRSDNDLYVVETMPLLQKEITKQGDAKTLSYLHEVLCLLPSLTCWNPVECLFILRRQNDEMMHRYPDWHRDENDQLMDDMQFQSEVFQRPYQYLKRYASGSDMTDINPDRPEDDHVACLEILIRYCGIIEPSWAELSHFVNFLNVQLCDCELSDFCHSEQDLPGFRTFVVKFMINMSRDFATKSLDISEQTPDMAIKNEILQHEDDEEDRVMYLMKRRWETSPHPYVFFNTEPDTAARHSMTFIGFSVNRNGDIVDPRTHEVLDENVISRELQNALRHNRINLNEDFDQLPRHVKIERLCAVMGCDMPHDPDPTYELTNDNVKKILAIHMRFRCGIPVIIMGETGCGKTRLIKFMCDLQKPPGAPVENLILIKVHGGTTEEDIIREVNQASEVARQNKEEFRHLDTVIFFDEANTTECIGLIKEIMCDHRLKGRPLSDSAGLKFVVACNPYRRHSDAVIKRWEQAGLGYHIKAEETKDRLGHIPMRQLVYRVHALPQSMLPLVWDFGTLTTDIETLYIRQMVERHVKNNQLPNVPEVIPAISTVLASSQKFMKEQKDECSFVSLRDVDRVLQVMAWFHRHRDHIFVLMNDKMKETEERDDAEDETSDDEEVEHGEVNDVTRMLILALGVCYHASLLKREEYREYISAYFQPPLTLPNGADTIETEIDRCQDVFLEKIVLGDNIARNQALKENLFMMIICIELRIPLFLIGKPGSSKSLAKTIVNHAMQGDAANNELFRHLKQVHMVSFQCSPLSTSEGIAATFRQCAQLQDEKDLEHYVAVVVLDEVGLAEDSPLMPLKVLHPLLEDGCIGEERPSLHKKVACVAISNWALDPAKMNRGIHVQRGVPGIEELKETAKGICSTNEHVFRSVEFLVQPLAEGYLRLYQLAFDEKREFFGLRDFYSLVKMVYGFSEKSGQRPTWHELKYAILRNFGGLDRINPLEIFETTLQDVDKTEERRQNDPECTQSAMIHASLFGDGLPTESRYLLLLTENYAALTILHQTLLDSDRTTVIFGSSFPKDLEYTQVCRNINKIKMCMESGRTVVLLNLDNLYESLYDALNQYYVKLGDARFVDLGLGTQRMKCEVHKEFKLVVVAEKQVVYDKFPIPLINRLEKHILTMSTMLTEEQLDVAQKLDKWTQDFAQIQTVNSFSRAKGPTVKDVFVGYHADTAASVVMHVCRLIGRDHGDEEWKREVLERSQDLLLQCATPDSIIRLGNTCLPQQLVKAFVNRYHNHQKHSSLQQLLDQQLSDRHHQKGMFLQVTTHSKLLSSSEVYEIGAKIGYKKKYVMPVLLPAFDTEHQFCKMLREFLNKQGSEKLLFIQCNANNQSGDLIASTRYIIQDESSRVDSDKHLTHIILIIQLSRSDQGNFIGFQGGRWISYHVDELHPESKKHQLPDLSYLEGKSLADLYEEALILKNIIVSQTQSVTTRNVYCEDSEEEETINKDRNTYVDSELPDIQTEEGGRRLPESENFVTEGKGSKQEFMLTKPRMENERPPVTDTNMTVSLDVDSLVHSCIHKAAVMLKDAEVQSHRKTERIPLLLNLLDPKQDMRMKNHLTVLDVFHKRICKLLREKEETVMSFDPSGWLYHEAATVDSVKKAGTLLKALNVYVEDKIVPLLAGLIAYADRSRNLDLIWEESSDSWIYQFWLRMFDDTQITPRRYSDLETWTVTRKGQNLAEFRVETSGFNKSLFSVRLPFSWAIYDQINSLLFQTKSLEEHLLLYTPLGQILKWVSDYDNTNDLVDRYLHDFVHMVYKAQSDNPDTEFKLIMESIRQAHREHHMSQNDGEGDPSLTLCGIHLTYSQIQRRINLCVQAFQVWPSLVNQIESEQNANNMELFHTENEMVLDIQILYLMLKELELNKDFDDNTKHQAARDEWIQKADTLFPIIECIFDITEGTAAESHHGSVYHKYLILCRCQWTKILAVYLFVQHVCPPTVASKSNNLYKCMPLWKLLSDEANMKKLKSFSGVERFLVSCNKLAASYYFKKEKCKQCNEVIDNPVSLPCQHCICLRCVKELNALNQRICPNCNKDFPAGMKMKAPKDKEKQAEEHNQYKERCNAFFMDLVSRLCFGGTTPPEMDVMKKLMSYVICEYKMKNDNDVPTQTTSKTHPLGVLKDSIDPTPEVRSFLLQLLLRSSIEQVRESLQEFFTLNKNLLNDSQYIVELSLLCVNCLEDHYFTKANKVISIPKRMKYIHDLLIKSRDGMTKPGLDFNKLEALAGVRFALSEVAVLMHAAYVKETDFNEQRRWLQTLFASAHQTCIPNPNDQISKARLYLINELFHRFGQADLEIIASEADLQWVLPPALRRNQGDTRPDAYIILGEHYKQVRDAIPRILLGENIQILREVIQNDEISEKERERNILLAIYREITTGIIQPEDRRPDEKIKSELGSLLLIEYKLHEQDLLSRLLTNSLAGQCSQLILRANNSFDHMTIIELLVHYWIAISRMEENKLPEPLRALVCQPQDMSYLPSMPDDHLEEVRKVLLQARKTRGPDRTAVLWQCPNGHPYIIGDCGRPYYEDQCKVCGATIGGTNHIAAEGNNLAEKRDDHTSSGHILGRAQQRPKFPIPERLNHIENTILCMMVHMSMYLGANRNSQSVRRLVKQPAQVDDISEFLWEHLVLDLELIATALGKNKEDAALFMHLLLKHMLSTDTPGLNRIDKRLRTPEARKDWETQFTEKYITPVLTTIEESLHHVHNELVQDNRLGGNPLFCFMNHANQLNESDPQPDVDNIQEVNRIWAHRPRITVEHLTWQFHKSSRQLQTQAKGKVKGRQSGKILQLFLREEHHLRVLKCLPSIIQLQHILSQKFHRNIDSADAEKITIGEFKEKNFKGHHLFEFEELLAEFIEAWDHLRGEIGTFAVGGSTVPAEYCEQRIDDNTCLAMLLPSLHRQGLCATALVHRLVQIHNHFMEEYSKIIKQRLMFSINVQDITQHHLVSYHIEQDLLPVILANCNYTLTAGQRTKVEYDFHTLERQIEERFIRGRPRLIPEVTFIVYREEFTNAAVFRQLENKIQQEALQGNILQQVHGIHLTDLNDSLATLNITIGFLISVGGDKDAGLLNYIKKLRMDCGSLRRLAQKCCLKHVESLWLLLSHERAKLLTAAEQNAFDQVPAAYHEELNEDLQEELLAYFHQLHHRDYLLPQLYEFIMLHVARKPETPNSEDYLDDKQFPLGYSLYAFLEGRGCTNIEVSLSDDRFPNEVLIKHCVSTWKIAFHTSRAN